MSDNPVERFLQKHSKKNPLRLERLSRYSIDNDRWDRREFDQLLAQQPEVSIARQRLADNIAGDLGYDEAADLIWMLNKVNPTLLPETGVRPSRWLNRKVNEIARELPQMKNLRRYTTGDAVASALAFEKIEPEIEPLYDRLQDAQKKQDEYEEALKQAMKAKEEEETAEEMLQKWLDEQEEEKDEQEEGEGEGEGDEEGEEEGEGEPQEGKGEGDGEQERLEGAVQTARGKADQAQARASAALSALEGALNGSGADIRETLGNALDKANDYLETMNNMASSWGADPGDLMRLPAEKRLELAKRLNTPKFVQMARLVGPMVRDAFAEQKRKVIYTPEEIVDLTLGDDIPRLIPPELARFDMEETELLFFKDLVERSLVQYEMKGFENIARGGIIYCHDGSLSMSGDREIWAKAVGLALLHVARKEKRSFYGIQFGSESEIRIDDFRDTSRITPDQVIDFAEFFFNGGTHFMAPLKVALDILQKENAEFGAIQADIVFATDGQSYISDEFMTHFKTVQARLGFKVWGIAIGTGGRDEVQAEPLSTLCDEKVATIKTLLNSKDIRSIFRGL